MLPAWDKRVVLRRLVVVLVGILVLAAGLLVAWWVTRPKSLPPVPNTTRTVTYSGTVASVPVLPGDPVVVRVEAPDSRWKMVSLATEDLRTRTIKLDLGIGYEVARFKFKKGLFELPEVTGDVVVTPDRVGIGGGLALMDHLDLEGGVSRRWKDGQPERYLGFGFHFTF